MRTAAILVVLSFGTLIACGTDAGKGAPTPEKKVAEKTAPPAEVKPEAKVDDALHLDVTHDKSGVLARAASALETSEAITNPALKEHLAGVSHHAEKGPTNEALCTHMTALMGKDAPSAADCIHGLEHERVHVGPEIFAEVAKCVTDAKTLAALMRCEDAETEAEKVLHEKKHGTGVEKQTCTDLVAHFEKLAIADAGDQAQAVEEILKEVRADVLEACDEQGTRTEVDCALKAKTMQELGACDTDLH